MIIKPSQWTGFTHNPLVVFDSVMRWLGSTLTDMITGKRGTPIHVYRVTTMTNVEMVKFTLHSHQQIMETMIIKRVVVLLKTMATY